MEALIFALLVAVVGLVGIVIWIFALVDAIRTPDERLRSGTQLIWILVILFANLIGAILYLAMGRPARTT